jgi:hypothetical protein
MLFNAVLDLRIYMKAVICWDTTQVHRTQLCVLSASWWILASFAFLLKMAAIRSYETEVNLQRTSQHYMQQGSTIFVYL